MPFRDWVVKHYVYMENAKTLFEQMKKIFVQFNIPHHIMQGELEVEFFRQYPHLLPFDANYQIHIMLQDNRLGHQDVVIYANKETLELIGVHTTKTTQKLLDTSEKLKMLYGIPYKKMERAPESLDQYYYFF